jgi:tRNA-specific 2-thiouridylase
VARIAVLLSGGIDSSGAALLLSRSGHEVWGITADWAGGVGGGEDLYRAGRVCHKLGIPHLVLDLRADFDRFVVRPFIEVYLQGLTPNPCAHCNREVKLGRLLGMVVRLGFGRVATGHYAGLGRLHGYPVICEPVDRAKSQTYFLSLVRPEILDVIDFPVATYSKQETTKMVAEAGLPARQRESQDLCFITSGRHQELLRDESGGIGDGDVLDLRGRVVGRHRGHFAYTVGQRLGAEGERRYVIEKRPESNQIVVAERQKAFRRKITANHLNCFIPMERIAHERLLVKYRYNTPAVGASIVKGGCDRITLEAETPCFAPAPGQVLAAYLGDCLVFGGIIEAAA